MRLRLGRDLIAVDARSDLRWSPSPVVVRGERTHLDLAAARAGLDSAGLPAALRAAHRVTILLPDRTRPAGLDVVLPAVFSSLDSVGGERTIEIGVGGGTHAPGDPRRALRWVPESWQGRVSMFNHDSRAAAGLIPLGTTAAGTEVQINARLLESDLLLVTGGIGYHYFAGFSGGRKGIFPGFGGYESIRQNHRLILDPTRGLHPACRPGNLVDNPVHEDLLECVARLPTPAFLVNVTLDPDERAVDLAAGDVVDAHREAARRVHARERVEVEEPFDVVVTDAGGHPRDIDLVQTHKSLLHASPLCREGGVIVMLAACSEGVGSTTFEQWFDHPDSASLEAAMRRDYTLNAHTALSVRRLTERLHILLVSTLDPARVRRLGAHPTPDLKSALDAAVDVAGTGARAVVVTSPGHHVFEPAVR